MPRFVYVVRNDVADPRARACPAQRPWCIEPDQVQLRRQLDFFEHWPDAAVVFDHTNDFPLAYTGWNVHIDRRQPAKAKIEWDGWIPRLTIAAKLAMTGFQPGGTGRTFAYEIERAVRLIETACGASGGDREATPWQSRAWMGACRPR